MNFFQYIISFYERIIINDLRCNMTTQLTHDLVVSMFILVHKVEYLKDRCFTHAYVMTKFITVLFVNDFFWSVLSAFCLHC